MGQGILGLGLLTKRLKFGLHSVCFHFLLLIQKLRICIIFRGIERSMAINPNIFKNTLLIILHLPDDFIQPVFYITGFCQLLCFLSLNLRNSFFGPIYEVLKLIG